MIYFAVTTLHLYRASIAVVRGPQTPQEFIERNSAVIKRLSEEAIELFQYELSPEQIDRAVVCYLTPGQIVAQITVATLP